MNRKRFRLGLVVLACLIVIPAVLLTRTPPLEARGPQDEDEPVFTFADWPLTKSEARGAEVYKQYCSGCHGDEGLGDGAAAEFLRPLPRNFQRGAFKFRSTPTGKLPSEEDLLHTITCGLPGSSMPSFRLVPEPKRRDVARYVLAMATFRHGRNEVEDRLRTASLEDILADEIQGIRDAVFAKRVSAIQAVAIPPSPNVTPDLIARGRERYLKECVKCHGETGIGDGPSSFSLRDWKDDEILARDFTTGVFRAGSRPEDLYRRLKTGLNGTPMPSIPGEPEELWALVHYMLSLKIPGAKGPWVPMGCGGNH